MKTKVKFLFRGIIITIIALLICGIVMTVSTKQNRAKLSAEDLKAKTYAQLTEDDEKIENCEFVKFGAFFTRDLDGDGRAEKMLGTCKEINSSEELWMDLRIIENGYLKNGLITIEGTNFNLSMNMVKDSVLKENYVSRNVKTIELNDVYAGTQKAITGVITSKIENENSFTSINKIILTGTHVNDEGIEVNIRKVIDLTVDWYGEAKADIKVLNNSYNFINDFSEGKDMKICYGFTLSESYKQLIVKKNIVKVAIPSIYGIYPTEVMCDKNCNVNNYNKDQKVFEIEDNNPGSASTYILTLTYPAELYDLITEKASEQNIIYINSNIQGYMECANNKSEEFKNPFITSTVSKNAGVTITIKGNQQATHEFGVEILNKQYVTYPTKMSALSKQEIIDAYDVEDYSSEDYKNPIYKVKWTIHRSDTTSSPTTLVFRDGEDGGDRFDNDFIENYVLNKAIYFDSTSLLGSYSDEDEQSTISVYNDETDELIKQFTIEEAHNYTSNNPYYYEEGIKDIRIETSKDRQVDGFLSIGHIRELDIPKIKEHYTRTQVENIGRLTTTGKVDGDNMANTFYQSDVASMVIAKSYTELRTNLQFISTSEVNPVNMKLNVTIPKESITTTKWVNGVFCIKVPSDIIYMELNDVIVNKNGLNIDSYELYKEQNQYFIRILTSNDDAVSDFNIEVDCDILASPIANSKRAEFELYSYNEFCNMYSEEVNDEYDINNNEINNEIIGKTKMYFSISAPSTFVTTETVSNYNDKDEITIAPNVAEVEKDERQATINIAFVNNYSRNVSNVRILGKIPFKGNTYISGNSLGSEYTANMNNEGLVVPEELEGKVTIYYSENENPTEDINNINNGWVTKENVTSFDSVRTYLIIIDDNAIVRGKQYNIFYNVTIPENIVINAATYSCHIVYCDLQTDGGALNTTIQPNKVGIRTVRYYDFDVVKYKEGTSLPVKGAKYQLAEVTSEGEENFRILGSSSQGKITLQKVRVNQIYTFKEIQAAPNYELNTDVIKFVVKQKEDGTLEFEQLSEKGFASNVQIIENQGTREILKATVIDEPKAKIVIRKVDSDTQDPISGVTFVLNNIKYLTGYEGYIEIDDISVGKTYTISETTKEGYYNIDDIEFTIIKQADNTFVIESDNEDFRNATIVNDDSKDLINISIVLNNEHIPTYDLKIVKVDELNEEIKLENAKFLFEKVDLDKKEYIKTNENGEIVIPNLYQFVEGKNVTGKYILTETESPNGYSNVNEKIIFYVLKDENDKLVINIENQDELKSIKNINIDNSTVEMVIQNKPLLKIKKIDYDTHEPLANVKFVIYELDENGVTVDFAKDINNNYVGTANSRGVYEVITNEEGIISVPLRDGKYKLIESAHLEGYEKKSVIEIFTISGSKMIENEEVVDDEYKFDIATLEINCIEDLVGLFKNADGKNRYADYDVKLMKNLDFQDDNSYSNPNDDSFGDLNGDGTVSGIKDELTDENGKGFGGFNSLNFAGTFDGQGFELRNYYADEGLFRETENSARITRLGITGKIKANNKGNLGSIVSTGYGTLIDNCYSKVNIEITNDTGYGYVGGILGNGSTVISSYYTGNIIANGNISIIGGIVGTSQIILNSYNKGNITANTTNNCTISGIGYSNYTIKNCYNVGNITSNDILEGNSDFVNTVYTIGYVNDEEKNENKIINCYVLDTATFSGTNIHPEFATIITSENMKKDSFVNNLGNAYWKKDENNKNEGYPIIKDNTLVYKIEYIEDLVDLSFEVNYLSLKITLERDLDFEDSDSYRNATTMEYGDYNNDGIVEDLKTELTNKDGTGFRGIDYFNGEFDGKNHEIKNYYSSGSLFQQVECFRIKDFILSGIVKSNNSYNGYASGICGYIGTASGKTNRFENCINKCAIVVNNSKVAGIIGASYANNNNLIVLNCKNYGDIQGHSAVSGILGYTSAINNSFINCENYGNITSSDYDVSAGIIGIGNNNIDIVNCKNEGEITGKAYVSGIIGRTYSGKTKIVNTYNIGNIQSEGQSGGIVASAEYSTYKVSINNCYNSGKLSGIKASYSEIGGIIGSNYASSSIIMNSYNRGNIEVGNKIGGICGYSDKKTELFNCYNIGNIDVSNQQSVYRIGGIIGHGVVDISNCYNTGNIKGFSAEYVAGIIGYASGQIRDSFNNGTINVSSNMSEYGYIGGIGGYDGEFSNCYNTANITVSSYSWARIGGICGSGTLEKCYNLGNIKYENASSSPNDIGGICGYGNVTKSFNKGSITCTNMRSNNQIGGIVGQGSVSNSYNTGKIYLQVVGGGSYGSYSYVGGILGKGNVENCYNLANIEANMKGSKKQEIIIGGIVGNGQTITNAYNVGNINCISENIESQSYTWIGGISGCAESIVNTYNEGNVTNEQAISNGTNHSSYIGGINGNYSGSIPCTISNSYNVGSVYNNLSVTSEDIEVKKGTGALSGNNDFIDNSYYSSKINIIGIEKQQQENSKLSDSYMKTNEFKEQISKGQEIWKYMDGYYPILDIPVYSVSDKSTVEIIIPNKKEQYDITTEILANENNEYVGGTITGEYNDKYLSIGHKKLVEVLNYNESNTQEIVITPDEGYIISKILINDESLPITNNDETYIIPRGYFKEVKEVYNVAVMFSEMSKVFTIQKNDDDGNPVQDAIFNIDEIDTRPEITDEIGNLIPNTTVTNVINYENKGNQYIGELTRIRGNAFTIDSEGRYVSPITTRTTTETESCVKIDLTNADKDYYLAVTAHISGSSHPYMYFGVSDSTAQLDRNTYSNWFVSSFNYSTPNTRMCQSVLEKGNVYYLHILVYSYYSGYKGFVDEINLYEADSKAYTFEKIDGKIVSNNSMYESTSTCAKGTIPIDLTNGSKKYILKINAEAHQTGNTYNRGSAYIRKHISETEKESATMINVTGESNAKDYILKLEGGFKYDIDLEYYNYTTYDSRQDDTRQSDNKFIINSVSLELDKSDLYHEAEIRTNIDGQIIRGLKYGTYEIKEVGCPQQYELNTAPVRHTILSDSNNTITIVNKKYRKVTAHYLKNGTGPEFNNEAVQLKSDEFKYGLIGEEYTTTPYLDINKYSLVKENNKYKIPENASGTFAEETIDVYYYYEEPMAEYKINHYYYNLEESDYQLGDTETRQARIGTIVSVSDDMYKLLPGYEVSRVEGSPFIVKEMTSDANEINNYGVPRIVLLKAVGENQIDIYYDLKESKYSIRYYYDGKENEDNRITGEADCTTVISNYEDKIIDGYKLEKTENCPMEIKENADENIMKVFYIKDSFNYTVEYYYDGIKDDSKTETEKALFDSEISIYKAKNITGYKFDHDENVPLRITSNHINNVIKVYYVKDLYNYTVKFYYDGVEDTEKIVNKEALYQTEINTYEDKNITGYKLDRTENLPLTVTENPENNVIKVYYIKNGYEYSVHYYYDGVEDESKVERATALFGTTIETYTDKNITGYKLEKTEHLPLTVGIDASQNIIKVYYIKDSFNYIVRYFYDGIEDALMKENKSALFGSVITTYTDKVVAGYKLDHVENIPLTIKADSSENVIDVYYVKDSFDYIVEYYYDGIKDDSKTFTEKAVFNSQITSYTDKVITGYKIEKVENLPLTITTETSLNVIKVFYVKDSFNYTIHYFYEGIEDISKMVSEKAVFGTIITEYEDKLEKGYILEKTEHLPLTITENPQNNVINVYYIKANIYYAIEYYYDGVKDENATVRKVAKINDEIRTYDDKVKDKYEFEKVENLPLIISDKIEENVIKVYYKRIPAEDMIVVQRHIELMKDGTETVLLTEESEVKEGQSLTVERKTFDKLEAADGPETEDENVIVMKKDQNTITLNHEESKVVEVKYYYSKKKSNITVEYVDNLTEKTIRPSTTVTGIVDEDYNIERINIPGYKLDETRLPNNEQGKFTEAGDTVRYYYIELRKYDLEVLYTVDNEPESDVKLNITNGNGESVITTTGKDGIAKFGEIEATDLGQEQYTIYEENIKETFDSILTKEKSGILDINKTFDSEKKAYVTTAKTNDIKELSVVVDDVNRKITVKVDIIIKYNLAIKKYITKIDDMIINDRAPVPSMVDGKIVYSHNDRLEKVNNNQKITYTIRMFNESEVTAKGKRAIEHIPDGLVFDPDDEVNKENGWVMFGLRDNAFYRTENVDEAVVVVSDNLVNKQIKERNQVDAEIENEDGEENGETKELLNSEALEVVFRADESKLTSDDRIAENKVVIMPNKNDDDRSNDESSERVYINYFDLDLTKYIKQVVVKDGNSEEVIEVGKDKKGELFKIDIKQSKLKNTKIIVTYGIIVKNIGEIPGYAKEIIDYVPENFVLTESESWKQEGNIAVTNALENVLVNPQEQKEIQLTFEWDLSKGNVGERINEAKITKYTNDFDAKDPTEDNNDSERMLVTVKTGNDNEMIIKIVLRIMVVVTIGVIIKKKVVIRK